MRPNEFMSTHTEIHISLRDLEKFFRKLKSKFANDLKLSLTIWVETFHFIVIVHFLNYYLLWWVAKNIYHLLNHQALFDITLFFAHVLCEINTLRIAHLQRIDKNFNTICSGMMYFVFNVWIEYVTTKFFRFS